MLEILDDFFLSLEGKSQAKPSKTTKPLGEIPSDLVHGSLFSGVGGFELGAERAGIKTTWCCEIEEDCRRILKACFPNTQQFTDITKLKKPPYVDIMSGGFPCQDISVANVSNEEVYTEKGQFKGIYGERSGLWKHYLRLIEEGRPKYAIIENSPLLTRRGLNVIIKDLAKIGYCIEWQILSASMLGYPHYRKRFFGIAYPVETRCKSNLEVFSILQEILRSRTPGQIALPRNFKRYGTESNWRALRIHDGISEGMDKEKRTIEMMGNAVMPELSELLFNSIKMHYERVNQC